MFRETYDDDEFILYGEGRRRYPAMLLILHLKIEVFQNETTG